MSDDDTRETHWGLASKGSRSLCDGKGPRRANVRLVTCGACRNAIDTWLHANVTFAKGERPALRPMRSGGAR